MNQVDVGKIIKEARINKQMTQQQLADKLGVTDRAVSNWENGIRMPDYSLLSDLCLYLDLDINEILISFLDVETFIKKILTINHIFQYL